MLGNKKVILWIVLGITLLGVAYYWYSTQNKDVVPAPLPTVGTEVQNPFALPSGTDTADVSLATDLSSIDVDVTAMTADSTEIDAGLSDKPISQN